MRGTDLQSREKKKHRKVIKGNAWELGEGVNLVS